ncbi:unnamed protein product [Paramecium octaurelia]|uniref:Uncharacterized protein n=1 Tax=Paramecium octaurelia TaxID=43137 RepID=A0A8S1WFV4_PAROT|nr:unnamed protein product [Paramecium octaurelia]
MFLYKIQEEQTKNIRPLQQNYQVTSIMFSPDEQLFAYATTNGLIIIYSLVKQKVRCICFSSEGNILVSAGDDKSVRIWDYMKGIQIGENLHGHSDVINSVEFSKPDGMIILSAGKDGLVKQWHQFDSYRVSEYLPEQLQRVKIRKQYNGILKQHPWLIKQQLYRVVKNVQLIIYVLLVNQVLYQVLMMINILSQVDLVTQFQFMIVTLPDKHFIRYHVQNQKEKSFFQHILNKITQFVQQLKTVKLKYGTMIIEDNLVQRQPQITKYFLIKKQNLVVLNQIGEYTSFKLGSGDRITSSYQNQLINTASEIKQLDQQIVKEMQDSNSNIHQSNDYYRSNQVTRFALSSDYSYLAIASKVSNVYIIDTQDLSNKLYTYSYQGVITSIHFYQNDLVLILSFEDLSIKVWDIENNLHGIKYDCHQASINCFYLSLDNKFLVSTSQDKCIKIWKMSNLSENSIIPKDIDGLKKKIYQQKLNFQKSFEILNRSIK